MPRRPSTVLAMNCVGTRNTSRGAPPSLSVLIAHLLQEALIDIKGDHPRQGRIARKRVATEKTPDGLHNGNVLGGRLGENMLQGLIVAGPEKGEGRGQRAGRDPRHNIEF